MARDDGYRYAIWTAEWKGGMRTDVSGRGHTLRSDEPPEFGGTDTGPMPTEILCASLAACFCLAVVWAAGKRSVELPDLEVEVQPHRAVGEPRHGSYDVWVLLLGRAGRPGPVRRPGQALLLGDQHAHAPPGDPVPRGGGGAARRSAVTSSTSSGIW